MNDRVVDADFDLFASGAAEQHLDNMTPGATSGRMKTAVRVR